MSTSTTTIQIGDGGSAYVFDVPPEFTPQITVLRNARGERIGEQHTWPVRGYLRGAGPDNVNTLFNNLKTRLQTEQVNVYFKHGDTILQQLLAGQVERGPRFDGPSVESGDDTCWDSNLQFSFDITAEIYSTQDGVIDVEYSVSYRQNEDGSYTRTKSGSVRTEYGTSAHTAALAQAPSVPSNYKLTGASVTPNDDDTEASFTFTMESLFSTLPDQVLIAERVVDESVENGVKTTTYRATFTGPGATRAAENYKPDGAIIRQSKSISEDGNSVTISYTTQDSVAGVQQLQYFNSVTIIASLPETEEFPVENADPLLMKGARRTGILTENGHAVYGNQIPPEHPPLSDSRFTLTRKDTSVRPYATEITGSPTAYIRTWNYSYRFTTEVGSDAELAFIKGLLDG